MTPLHTERNILFVLVTKNIHPFRPLHDSAKLLCDNVPRQVRDFPILLINICQYFRIPLRSMIPPNETADNIFPNVPPLVIYPTLFSFLTATTTNAQFFHHPTVRCILLLSPTSCYLVSVPFSVDYSYDLPEVLISIKGVHKTIKCPCTYPK